MCRRNLGRKFHSAPKELPAPARAVAQVFAEAAIAGIAPVVEWPEVTERKRVRMERLISLFGLVVMIALVFAMSADRSKVDRRLVGAGVGLQFLLALLVSRPGPDRRFSAI